MLSMKPLFILAAVVLILAPVAAAEEPPKPLVEGLKNPTAVAVGFGGKVYVTVAATDDKDAGGAVLRIDDGKAVPFATGLDHPQGLAAFMQWLFVADRRGVWRIDGQGKVEPFAPRNAFPEA